MRLGLMIGPEKGQYRSKVERLIDAAQQAEREGFASIWVPQVPNDFDALTAVALDGPRDRSRVEIGTAVMPIQTRHPVAMAQQALANQAVCEGRFTLGLGPSHHWIVEDMLGLSYDRPAQQVRDYLDVLNVALAGPGPVDVENDGFRIHNPLDVTDIVPTPIVLAALAPVMLRLAGAHASGTILWMADERAIGDHVVPRISKAAADAGRPEPRIIAGVPVALCRNDEVDAARDRARIACSGTPSSRRTINDCSNTAMPLTSATSWRAAMSAQSCNGSNSSAMRASPTCRFASCRSGPTARRAPSRGNAPKRSSRRSAPRSNAQTAS